MNFLMNLMEITVAVVAGVAIEKPKTIKEQEPERNNWKRNTNR